MNILLVKTSSLGDVVHALPAVTEALSRVPGLVLDWVVEEELAAIPHRHPGVNRVIPVALRRWRRSPVASRHAFRRFRRQLRETSYDLVLDSQGLLKSALTGKLASGPLHGFDSGSAREAPASWLYRKAWPVDRELHAVFRQKRLFGAALGYAPTDDLDFGLASGQHRDKRIILVHGTTWRSKEWPESCWVRLAELLSAQGYELLVAAGDDRERRRAERIIASGGELLFRPPLAELMDRLASCCGAVSVDTGLGHLASALGVAVVGIFGATSPELTGIRGAQTHMIASTDLPCIPCRKRDCQFKKPVDSSSIYPPCYQQTTPETVWQALQQQTGNLNTNRV